MKRTILTIVFGLLAIFLGYILIDSIMEPIRFEREKNYRYRVAIDRLKDIRTAQVAYRSENDRYTKSFDTLIDFIRSDSFRVVRQIGSLDDSAAVAEGRVRRDTINVSILDSLFSKGYPIDSLRFVPFTNGVEFAMDAGELKTLSEVVVQVFEAKVPNKVLLNGLDYQQIVNLDDVAYQLDRYPGLKVGSMTEATNNAGNWE